MATTKKATVSVNTNNSKTLDTNTKQVELVVVNDRLVPDDRDTNPGVNSANLKN